MTPMLPVRDEHAEAQRYQEHVSVVRERILGYVVRRLVPHACDFAEAEDIAQSCVVAILEQYPEKRDLAEMIRIAIGVARNKVAQFHRDRERASASADLDRAESPHSGDRIVEQIAAHQDVDRLLLGMLRLPPRCRDLMRLKLIEQKSYPEIRGITGITGNIYEMTRRCFRALLREFGGPS